MKRKPLAPVFIVEEDIRPLDLTANINRLVIKEMANLSDMNLQHPELIPLLIATEPSLKENEWIEVEGLMSRSSVESSKREQTLSTGDDACICIVERTSSLLIQDDIYVAQASCLSILDNCYNEDKNETISSKPRSKTASMSSANSSNDKETSDEDSEDSEFEQNYEHKPKRQCFADRLKLALERGCTPDEDSNFSGNKQPNGELSFKVAT